MTRQRSIIAALAAPLALLLLFAACPGVEEEPPPDLPPEVRPEVPPEDPDPPPPAEPDPDDVALEESCTNPAYGFRVGYPGGWVVNPANGLPPCSAFDPRDASMPAAAEIPTRIAVVIHRDDVAFATVIDFDADPTVRAVSRRQATVDGRSAIVAELEHTGDGMYPRGHRHYAWYVDLGQRTLVGMTHDVDAADPPPYAERRRILDRMMGSLRFQ